MSVSIPESTADAAAVNPNGLVHFLLSGISTF